MSQLKLHFLDEEQWTEINGVRVRGTAFRQGELLSDSRIADLLQRPMDLAQFRSATSSLNGYFAVVVQSNESLLAAVDRWRTWPLFYAIGTDDFYISDDAHWICDKVGCDEMDEVAKAEYIQSLFVTGSNTLFRNVNQIQAGELIMASTTQTTPSITTDQYYRFGRQRQIQDSSKDELIKEYESVLNNVFQRLIEFASGRPIAVSLSSGVDSRLIALKLVQMGYPELYSFSYTRSGQEDVAEDVASSLGINFDRISLSHREIYDWYHSEERRRFDRQSGIVDTVPNPWVAFAIKKLREDSSVPSDAIIVTGDGAQTMGEHIPEEFIHAGQISSAQLVDKIIDNYYFQFKISADMKKTLRERVLFTLDADLSDDANLEPSKSVISLFEEWDWRERQSKAIRSNYLYEYFGYQFWFPFKDHEYMDFCRNLPLKYRQGKALHEEYVEQQYREATSEVIVKPGFLTVPKWLWFVNRTVGRLPVVGKLARQLYRRICKSDFEYDPQFGMLSEDELETIIHKLVTDEADLGGLTARRIHALNLSEEYDIEVDDKERHGDYFYNLN